MKITPQLTDEGVLQQLGERLTGIRLDQRLTQAALAERAGVSKRTVERLESGEVATQLSGFLRVCRALGVLDRFETLLPEPTISPMAQLKMQGHQRQRQRYRAAKKTSASEPKAWSWAESP